MVRHKSTKVVAAIGVTLALSAPVAGVGVTSAAFSGAAVNPANEISAAPDFVAPAVSAAAIGKASGGLLGSLAPGGAYHVYAKVSDSGNPASGVAGVAADLGALSAGQSAVALEPGDFTVDGKQFNYRSAQLTLDVSLAGGSYGFSIATKDAAANARTADGFSLAVDTSAPTAVDVQAANGAATVGRPEQGDTVSFTYSEPIDPSSILAGWGGAETNVVVRIVNGGLLGLGNDELVVYDAANTTQLPLGVLDLGRADYVGSAPVGGLTSFGASVSASTMRIDGASIIVKLGAAAELEVNTAADTATMVWTPAAGVTDAAGNTASVATATESGAADKEF